MVSTRQQHWEDVYAGKAAGTRSWFQPKPETSLALLERAGFTAEKSLIDIGGGTSHLIDGLITRGAAQLAVLDISAHALEEAKRRIGAAANAVKWIRADITEADLDGPYDLWHDRAVFHFLTDRQDREAYLERLNAHLRPGGRVVIATFALDGPEKCSGLPVVRYSPESLGTELGERYTLLETRDEPHETPAGKIQNFVYCVFERAW